MQRIVLITGGAGFVGQHLVKYLEEYHSERFDEIRVADRHIFRQFLKFPRPIPVKQFIVDCSVYQELGPVVAGCSVVFNLCGRPLPLTVAQDDVDLQVRDNFTTVQTLLSAVLDHNVPNLIHVSDGICGCTYYDLPVYREIVTDEFSDQTSFWFGAYGQNKYLGEKQVRASNGVMCSDGKTILNTIALRPALIYGEGDSLVLPHLINLCENYGSLLEFGIRESKMDVVYAGNVAQMLLMSLDQLVNSPGVFGGETFFCHENNIIEFYAFYEQILNPLGYRVSNWNISSVVADGISFAWEKIFKFLNLLQIRCDSKLPTQAVVKAVSGMFLAYDGTKLKYLMNYNPIYDPNQSVERTLTWWKNHKHNKLFL